MKTWLKGGLISLVIGIVLMVISSSISGSINKGFMKFTYVISSKILFPIIDILMPNAELEALGVFFLLYIPLLILSFFIIGVLIGLTIEKIRN